MTPKCVLGVLSTGALGGIMTTGGLDGFLLEEVIFSVTDRGGGGEKGRKWENKARVSLQGYRFHQQHLEKLRMLALKFSTSSSVSELCWF